MASIFGREEGPRWARGQKFRVTTAGAAAEAQYQATLKEGRERGGRTAFDELTAGWAAPLGVRPGDGVFLAEVKGTMPTLGTLLESMESSGVVKKDATAALDRLIQAKLVELVPS